MRSRDAPDQQHHGDHGADQHTFEQAGPKHAGERSNGDQKFAAVKLPQALQHLHLHKTRDRHENDRCKDGLGQVAQEIGEEECDKEENSGGDDA